MAQPKGVSAFLRLVLLISVGFHANVTPTHTLHTEDPSQGITGNKRGGETNAYTAQDTQGGECCSGARGM